MPMADDGTAEDSRINRPVAFGWMTVSAVALTAVGALGQFGSVSAGVLFTLVCKFAVSALTVLLVVRPKEALRGVRRIPGLLWARVACVMLSQGAFYYYLSRGSLLNGMLLYNTGPLFSPLLAWCVFRKKITLPSAISIGLGFAGVALVLWPSSTGGLGLLFVGLASGFLAACSQIFLFGLAKEDESGDLFGFFALCTLGYAAVAAFQWDSVVSGAAALRQPLVALGLVAVGICAVANQWTRAQAYRRVRNPANLGPFLFLAVILSALIEAALGRLVFSWHLAVGGLLILGSAASIPLRNALRYSRA